MNKKKGVPLLILLVLMVIYLITNIHKSDRLSDSELRKELIDNPELGIQHFLNLSDSIKYFHGISHIKYNYGRVYIIFNDNEKMQLLRELQQFDFNNSEQLVFNNFQNDNIIGNMHTFLVSYNNSEYNLKIISTKDKRYIYLTSHLNPETAKTSNDLNEAIILLSAPNTDEQNKFDEFISSVITNTSDTQHCAKIEILNDSCSEFKNAGDVYTLNKAASAELLHLLKGTIFLNQPNITDIDDSYNIKISFNNNLYFLNSTDMIFNNDGKSYSLNATDKNKLFFLLKQ